MTPSFHGKVALITGGASGIGREAAVAFAEHGASVMVSDQMTAGGEETVQIIGKAGGKSIFVQADVTQPAHVKALLQEVERAYGRLDFALNNAGVDGVRANTADYPEQTWIDVINVNLTGVFLCMKYEIPLLLRQPGGVIVNLSSVAGVTGFPGHAAYTASKHGVIGLTKTAALEYAKRGLRINAICPAYTRTPMVERIMREKPDLQTKLQSRIPIGRLGTPQEIAAAAIYLCSDSGSFITGHSFIMDGGIMAE
jgi:NAD(P)-dependent dehydrogenase (short-subunit alcohol dehydrogenase family)